MNTPDPYAELSRPDKLLRFAKDVLLILERDKEWNADTLQSIADNAELYGLSATDAGHFFTIQR